MGFLDEELSIGAEASAKEKKRKKSSKQWHIANMLSVPASIIQPLAHNFIFNA